MLFGSAICPVSTWGIYLLSTSKWHIFLIYIWYNLIYSILVCSCSLRNITKDDGNFYYTYYFSFYFAKRYSEIISNILGAPGWLSQLSVCLWFRSWSRGAGMEFHVWLLAQQRVYFSLCLCPSFLQCSLEHSLSHFLNRNYWEILIQPLKRVNSCHLWQNRWTLRALCDVKKVRQEKTNTIRSLLYVQPSKQISK